jgi:hypothetical protein
LPYFEDFFWNCQIWTVGSSMWPKKKKFKNVYTFLSNL